MRYPKLMVNLDASLLFVIQMRRSEVMDPVSNALNLIFKTHQMPKNVSVMDTVKELQPMEHVSYVVFSI